MAAHRCEHGNVNTCPHDHLAQVRLRSRSMVAGIPDPTPDPWQTVMVAACDSQSPLGWQRQCAPGYRRRGYETRVVRLGEVAA